MNRRVRLFITTGMTVAAFSMQAQTVKSSGSADENVDQVTTESLQPAPQALFPLGLKIYEAKTQAKQDLKQKVGLELALENTTIYQIASGSRDANDAMVNTLSFFGIWNMWRHENKLDRFGLGLQMEQRGNFSGDSFPDMTADLGTLWSPNDSSSGDYAKIGQLWFGSVFAEGKLICLIGKIDPGAHINGNRFAGSGNTQFFSQPFATNPARAFPDDGLGAIVRLLPTKWLHIQGVVSDSDAYTLYSPFKTYEGDLFTGVETVLKTTFSNLGEGQYRFLLYYRDTDPECTHGWSLSFDQNLGTDFGVFARYGGNDGDAGAIEHLASTGISFLKPFGRRNDQAGVGISWTRPANNDFRDEYSAETYYRLQLTEMLELSGSAQMIVDPSTTDEDVVGVFGLRLRVLF